MALARLVLLYKLFLQTKRKEGKERMKKTVVGKKEVNYVSRKTNEQVTGLELHTLAENVPNVVGKAVETIFVSSKAGFYGDVLQCPINSVIDVQYNRWGSVDTILFVK